VAAEGLLDDVPKIQWDEGLHPNLHFISHIPLSVLGDQLVAQFFRCIPERSWMFQYGRVPMSLILNKGLYDRVSATTKSAIRCKVSVVADAVSHMKLAIPEEDLLPYSDHFYPTPFIEPSKTPKARTPGTPYVAMNVFPAEEPLITQGSLDYWDYVLRRIFVLKGTEIKKSINALAPGATNLLKTISSPDLEPEYRVDLKKSARTLSLKEWATIVDAFQDWPFAPEELNIVDGFHGDGNRTAKRV